MGEVASKSFTFNGTVTELIGRQFQKLVVKEQDGGRCRWTRSVFVRTSLFSSFSSFGNGGSGHTGRGSCGSASFPPFLDLEGTGVLSVEHEGDALLNRRK